MVRAAIAALDTENVDLILPFVPEDATEELSTAFVEAVRARRHEDSRALADRYFFETAVRLHRAGEGAPFNGLLPAGLDHGPVIPLAERALDSGDAEPLVEFLVGSLSEELRSRFAHVQHLAREQSHGVSSARAYTSAMLGLQVWAHGLYGAIHAEPHGEGHAAPAAAGHSH